MISGSRGTAILLVGALGLLPLLASTIAVRPTVVDDDGLGIVVEKIVGADRCGECHAAEHAAWKASRHQHGFLDMHRKPAAKSIAERLGIRRIKTATSCVRCHYTPTEKRGKVRAAYGVSCESCHGAARDWLDIHDGISDIEGDDEVQTAKLRQEAIDRCKANGMRRPDDLYDLVSSCYRCHIIDDERLVDVGGHPTGSNFELLSWSQGEIRHNYLESAGAENASTAPPRKRLLYVVGQTLDLQTSLRALAKATEDGPYRQALLNRIAQARGKLKEAAKLLGDRSDVTVILKASSLDFAQASAKAIADAAHAVDRAGRRLAASESGEKLSALDRLLPKPDTYRGQPRK